MSSSCGAASVSPFEAYWRDASDGLCDAPQAEVDMMRAWAMDAFNAGARSPSETPLNAAAPRSAVGARCIKCGVPEGAICGYVSRGAAECPQKISSHTPGPWRVAPPSIGRFKVVSVDGLKVVGEASNYNEQAEANARLIVAAPDLLAACEAAYDSYDMTGGLARDTADKLLAAIKKAKGE